MFVYPLPTQSVGLTGKLFYLMTTLGVFTPLHSDPGMEFTAEVEMHLYQWLNAILDHGAFDLSRAQRSVEILRVGFIEICKTCPWRWDTFMQAHRTTLDPRLPRKTTPFSLLLSRDWQHPPMPSRPRPTGRFKRVTQLRSRPPFAYASGSGSSGR